MLDQVEILFILSWELDPAVGSQRLHHVGWVIMRILLMSLSNTLQEAGKLTVFIRGFNLSGLAELKPSYLWGRKNRSSCRSDKNFETLIINNQPQNKNNFQLTSPFSMYQKVLSIWTEPVCSLSLIIIPKSKVGNERAAIVGSLRNGG